MYIWEATTCQSAWKPARDKKIHQEVYEEHDSRSLEEHFAKLKKKKIHYFLQLFPEF